jgi:hypothetical protein
MEGYQNKKRKIAGTRKTNRHLDMIQTSSLLIMTYKQSDLHRQKLSRSEALRICFRTAIHLETTDSVDGSTYTSSCEIL